VKEKEHSFPAIKLSKHGSGYFLTAIPVSLLFSCSYVSRAEEDSERGFQRLLDERRARRIGDYINEGNVVPGAIILSARQGSDIHYRKSGGGHLVFKEQERLFMVIDGQHRLYGAHFSDAETIMPCCIFTGLNLEEEIQYFLDVNGKQKGVPSTLRLELLKFMSEPGSRDQIRTELFKRLNSDPKSPLCGRMSPTRSAPGKLTHVPFKNVVDSLIDSPPLSGLQFDQKVSFLINYLSAVESLLIENEGSNKRLTNAAFFQAVMRNLPVASSRAMQFEGNYKRESFESVLDGLKDIELDGRGTNKKAIEALAKDIEQHIEKKFVNFDSSDLL